jgi:hypothetical protein
MMDAEEIVDIIHNHLDQAFDKVTIDLDEFGNDDVITVFKDGQTTSKTINIYHYGRDVKKLQNLKYELLKYL